MSASMASRWCRIASTPSMRPHESLARASRRFRDNVRSTQGDVPNLYAPEDDETITTACKQDCLRKRLQPTKLNIFACYLARVMANLHLILCFSPLGEAFRNRLRMFPSLVNCSTIDWFAEWPGSVQKSMFRGVVAPSLH